MKNCPNCNHPVIDSAKFCQKCGSALSESKAESQSVKSDNTKLPPAPPPLKRKPVEKDQAKVVIEKSAHIKETQEKPKKNSLALTVIGIVFVAALYGMIHGNTEVPSAPIAPHGYASIYMTEGLNGWGIGTGYQTQEEADTATLKNCQERNPGQVCTKKTGGAFKCGAVGMSRKWIEWQLNDDLGALKTSIITACKTHGGNCKIKPDAQVCSAW
jgi:hypothetical protein